MTARADLPARPARGWLQQIRADPPDARMRLFCFPHAGGGASAYRPWASRLPSGLGIYGLQLPGRESRMSQPPIDRLSVMLDQLTAAFQPYLGLPLVFFGHSMGALLAWELARSLRRTYRVTPAHIFVSGSRAAPYIRDSWPPLHDLPDQVLAERLADLQGTPPEILQNAEVMTLLLPAVRADFRLLASYDYQPGEPLDCPFTVFGGDRDPTVPPGELGAWADLTRDDTVVRVMPGGHFFLHDPDSGVCAAISERLGLAREGAVTWPPLLPGRTGTGSPAGPAARSATG